MIHSQPILAAGTSGAEIVVFLIILVVGWIGSAVDKMKKNRLPMAPPPPADTPARLFPPPPPIAPLAKTQRVIRAQQLKRQQPIAAPKSQFLRQAKKAFKQKASPPKTALPIAQPAIQPLVQPIELDAPRIQINRTQAAGATAIHDWLTPATLRKQFLLTEIFNPPIALRDERF